MDLYFFTEPSNEEIEALMFKTHAVRRILTATPYFFDKNLFILSRFSQIYA